VVDDDIISRLVSGWFLLRCGLDSGHRGCAGIFARWHDHRAADRGCAWFDSGLDNQQDDVADLMVYDLLRRAEGARIACQVSGRKPPATGTCARMAEPRCKCLARARADFSWRSAAVSGRNDD
jgi:hypothetical protein